MKLLLKQQDYHFSFLSQCEGLGPRLLPSAVFAYCVGVAKNRVPVHIPNIGFVIRLLKPEIHNYFLLRIHKSAYGTFVPTINFSSANQKYV